MSQMQVLDENLKHLERLEKDLGHFPDVLIKIAELKNDVQKTIRHAKCIEEAKWYYRGTILRIIDHILIIANEMLECHPENKFIKLIIKPLENICHQEQNDWYNIFNIVDSACFALAFQIGLNPVRLGKFAEPLFNCMSLNTAYNISVSDDIRKDRELDIAIQFVICKIDHFCSDGYNQ